jgi:lipopolysaccharide cholinephosphotransferase
MTEIERIIKKGVISESYLQEEVKNDFLIDTNRKKLWAIMLDLIQEFDRICKKYGFTYYMIYGALLGAVRHKGFIPWDDDFDVAMPREDYEKFIKLSDEFHHPYFLQTPQTDPEYFYSFAKIRNSNTTGVVKMFEYSNFNHGIWISVFPLDYWDNEGGVERYERIRVLARDCSTYMRMGNPNLGPKDMARVEAYHSNPMRDYEEIQRIASSCKDTNSKYMMTAVITQGTYEQKLLDTEAFKATILMEFEGLQLMAPVGYDHLLRVWYEDYMQFPPVEERGKWHDGTFFSAEIPYKDYLRNEGVI